MVQGSTTPLKIIWSPWGLITKDSFGFFISCCALRQINQLNYSLSLFSMKSLLIQMVLWLPCGARWISNGECMCVCEYEGPT